MLRPTVQGSMIHTAAKKNARLGGSYSSTLRFHMNAAKKRHAPMSATVRRDKVAASTTAASMLAIAATRMYTAPFVAWSPLAVTARKGGLTRLSTPEGAYRQLQSDDYPRVVRASRALLVCSNCCRRVREDDAERLGWRYRLEGTELRPVCALCALHERNAGAGKP